ncbi:hypothetical protein JOD67_005198 [Tenggerimyces flavus]|nr:hypothetical protein [Tenggerimyces flavus]
MGSFGAGRASAYAGDPHHTRARGGGQRDRRAVGVWSTAVGLPGPVLRRRGHGPAVLVRSRARHDRRTDAVAVDPRSVGAGAERVGERGTGATGAAGLLLGAARLLRAIRRLRPRSAAATAARFGGAGAGPVRVGERPAAGDVAGQCRLDIDLVVRPPAWAACAREPAVPGCARRRLVPADCRRRAAEPADVRARLHDRGVLQAARGLRREPRLVRAAHADGVRGATSGSDRTATTRPSRSRR